MQNHTHFWFALACILGNNILFSQFSQIEQFLLIPWAVSFSFISLSPNFLDKYFCVNRKTRTCTERCRHPATHNPIVFFLLIYILRLGTIGFSWSYFVVEALTLAIGSHLFLDMFSHEGIPLGFIPTLFVQDPTKNYVFNDLTKPNKRLCFSTVILSRDNWNTNRYISLGCKIIIIFLCLQLLLELKDIPAYLETIMKALHWMVIPMKGGIM